MHRFYFIIGLRKLTISFLVRAPEVIYSHLSDGPQHASVCCLCLPFFSTVAKAAACFTSRWFPAASSAQTDRASPAQRRERERKREETQRERPVCSTAEQSTALLPAPPPPLHRNTQMLACCHPPIHT